MASECNGGGGDGRAENGNGGGGVSLEMPEIKYTKLFIDGSFVDAVSGTCLRRLPILYILPCGSVPYVHTILIGLP